LFELSQRTLHDSHGESKEKSQKGRTAKAKTKGNTKVKSNAINDAALRKSIREQKARHLRSICAEIESLRASNGRIPRGELVRVLNEKKPIYNWLTVDLIKKELKKLKGSNAINMITVISDLTDDTSPQLIAFDNVPPPSNISMISEPPDDAFDFVKNKKGGRPKGSTIQASREKQEQTERLINEIVIEWVDERRRQMDE
jgi:hypothetical protein